MKTFILEKDSVAILGNNNGKIKTIICENDMEFDIGDMIHEPIRTYDRNLVQVVSRNLKFKFKQDDFEYIIVKYSDIKYIDC